MNNYSWGLPIQASTYAPRIDQSLLILHIAMFIIFGLWALYMIYCLIKYRAGTNPKATYSHHTPLSAYIPDIIIFLFEVWLIFIVGIPIWAHIKEELPKPENAFQINVRGEQFTWVIHYPGPDGQFGKQNVSKSNADNPLGLDFEDPNSTDDLVTVDQLHLPLGKPVLINLTSKDVIHSFFIPEFRIKQDAVPGMKIPVWFEPTQTGQYELVCAQLCGAGHYRMRADVKVQTAEEFETWMQQTKELKK